jgi:hypothetical protein
VSRLISLPSLRWLENDPRYKADVEFRTVTSGEDLAVVVVGRTHPIDLLLRHRNDLDISRQREEPVV